MRGAVCEEMEKVAIMFEHNAWKLVKPEVSSYLFRANDFYLVTSTALHTYVLKTACYGIICVNYLSFDRKRDGPVMLSVVNHNHKIVV